MKEKIKKLIKEYEKDKEVTDKLKYALGLYDEKVVDYDKAANLTCWGGLSYCCKSGNTGKECIFRDIALDLLKIDKEQFEKLKKQFDHGTTRLRSLTRRNFA
jgi:predicted metal-binding transcription factor (methanogenesis marker protein 9)